MVEMVVWRAIRSMGMVDDACVVVELDWSSSSSSLRSSERKISPGLALGEFGLHPNNLEVVVVVVVVVVDGIIDDIREECVRDMLQFRFVLPFPLKCDDVLGVVMVKPSVACGRW
jgi:hypothetical protein